MRPRRPASTEGNEISGGDLNEFPRERLCLTLVEIIADLVITHRDQNLA